MKDNISILKHLGACEESIEWMRSLSVETTPEQAYAMCSRGDWLVWLLGTLHKRGAISRQVLVMAGCAAARTSIIHLKDTPWEAPCVVAIETTERWCRGGATIEEVRVARQNAWVARREAQSDAAYADAADAADAAAAADAAYAYAAADADAYADAAYAAAAADAAAYAADAADAAADAADAAAYAADAADAYAFVARTKRRQEIADAVRSEVPWSTLTRAVQEASL